MTHYADFLSGERASLDTPGTLEAPHNGSGNHRFPTDSHVPFLGNLGNLFPSNPRTQFNSHARYWLWGKKAKLTFSFEADFEDVLGQRISRSSSMPGSGAGRIPNQGLSRSGKRPMILVTRKSLRVLLGPAHCAMRKHQTSTPPLFCKGSTT